MKVFGFEIRKFEKNTTTIHVVETWNVRWWSVREDTMMGIRFSPKEKENVQGFPTEQSARLYAKELKDARRLLGDVYSDPRVEIQRIPTNA